MSDLTQFRDHCARMATAEHKPKCLEDYQRAVNAYQARRYINAPDVDLPEPPPRCEGCVTDDQRALWVRLADEVDEYLSPHPDLFGGMSDEFGEGA